ncbi:MAG: DegV family protein, partial [Gemella sp.]|nr:DegV family protein [Gemella sp.]
NEEGKIELLQKARGDKKAAAAFVDYLMKQGYSGGLVRIAHRNNIDLVNKINEGIREKFENAKIQVDTLSGLCSFYAEDKGVVIGYETV